MPINLYAVYRIPNSSVISFCETLSNILTENIVTNHARPILLGDFNIHIDKPDNPDTITFLDFLDSLNLVNKVNFPTHTSGHMLDLIIEDRDLQLLSDVQWGFLLLDHHFILSKLLIAKLKPPTKEIATRQLKKIDNSKFQTDLKESLRTLSYDDNLQNIVCQYNKKLKDILDHHAPITMKKVKPSRHQLWYSERICDEIKIRWYKERLFRHDPNEYSLQAYKNQCRWVSSLIKWAQKEHYCDLFQTYQHDFKKVYQLTNSMLFRKQELPLPTSNNNSALAEKFSIFFNDKIAKIMTQLEASSVADSMYIENDYITTARHNFFLPVTEEDVRRMIMKSPAKACELDPIPMKLLKDNLDILLPTLTSIVCKSLSTGEFSDNLKEALLWPLLKAIQLDHEEFPNYRPVSNLSYISKLIERIVGEQLDFFASSSGNMEPLQSAYHKHHSTETALLKIQTDILDAMDDKLVTCLVLLDLSAAFDTVPHCELINRLKYRFGLGGVVLQWLTNYLTDCTQWVVIDANGNDPTTGCSGFTSVKQGVPQGSSLGPKLFTMFLSPVGDICRKHNIIFHFYADDSQIYMTFKPALDGDKEECLRNLEHCIEEIRTWMATNYLKFNMGKT